MDADVLMGDLTGYQGSLHTNNDDFMEYYDCKSAPEGCPVIDGEELKLVCQCFTIMMVKGRCYRIWFDAQA